jgi:hypothetical protein
MGVTNYVKLDQLPQLTTTAISVEMQVGVASPIPSHDIGDGRKPLQYLHLHIDVPAGGEKVLRDRGAGISLGDGVDQEWWCRRMAYRSFATTRSIVGSPPLRRSRLISNAREPAISTAIPLFDRRATTPGQQIRTDADRRAGAQDAPVRNWTLSSLSRPSTNNGSASTY